MMNFWIVHLLLVATLALVGFGVFTLYPGAAEAFAERFWDAALWVGGCFS